MLGLDRDSVILCEYNKEWKKEYEIEKENLKGILTGVNYKIEHVGSTSIEGLSAKPIIDIAIGAEDIDTILVIAERLENNCYDITNSMDTKGEVFAAKGPNENRTHYIHVELIGSIYWNNHIYFKKYLLDHKELIKEYEKLKKKLSIQYKNDRKSYTASKNEFISDVLKKAKELYEY